MACHPKRAVSGMFLYADDAKLFSNDSIDLQQSLTSVIFNYHLLKQSVSIYLLFATLLLIRPVINIILEIKRFLVCLLCVIWVLFLVTSNDANMFVALSLKHLYVYTKFYTVSVASMFEFCSKNMLLTSDHCLNITL